MNRTLDGATALVLAILVAAPARGQAPLVVGFGARPARCGDRRSGRHGSRRCRGPGRQPRPTLPAPLLCTRTASWRSSLPAGIVGARVVAVKPDEPIVLIMRRYDALADDSPSPSDLENLPYAHVESSIALHPFTLLAQSSEPYPGSLLSDRGLSPSGSLLIDDGAPNYDIVNGQSPYVLIPARTSKAPSCATQRTLTRTVTKPPAASLSSILLRADRTAEIAIAGSDAIARAQVGSDSSAIAVGSLTNDEESRQRGDVSASWPLGAQQSLTVAGGSEQGREYSSPDSPFAGSFSFADATFSDPRALNLSVTAVTDRGDYTTSADEYPTSAAWSDSGFDASIHSGGPVIVFADVGLAFVDGLLRSRKPCRMICRALERCSTKRAPTPASRRAGTITT